MRGGGAVVVAPGCLPAAVVVLAAGDPIAVGGVEVAKLNRVGPPPKDANPTAAMTTAASSLSSNAVAFPLLPFPGVLSKVGRGAPRNGEVVRRGS